MWLLRTVVTSTPVQGKTVMTEYVRNNKTYRYGDKNLSKADNKGIRAGRTHCSRLLNNDFGQVFVYNETRNQVVLLNKTLVQGMKTSSATNKDTRTTSRWCFGGFIANLIANDFEQRSWTSQFNK